MDVNSSVNGYKKLEVTSTNRLKLILMVYDAAIAALKQAQECHQRNDSIKRNLFISRAQLIIGELNNALDMDQGKEISDTLSKIYHFLNRHLTEANNRDKSENIGQALNILENLRDAWKDISAKTEQQENRSGNEPPKAVNSNPGNSFYG